MVAVVVAYNWLYAETIVVLKYRVESFDASQMPIALLPSTPGHHRALHAGHCTNASTCMFTISSAEIVSSTSIVLAVYYRVSNSPPIDTRYPNTVNGGNRFGSSRETRTLC